MTCKFYSMIYTTVPGMGGPPIHYLQKTVEGATQEEVEKQVDDYMFKALVEDYLDNGDISDRDMDDATGYIDYVVKVCDGKLEPVTKQTYEATGYSADEFEDAVGEKLQEMGKSEDEIDKLLADKDALRKLVKG